MYSSRNHSHSSITPIINNITTSDPPISSPPLYVLNQPSFPSNSGMPSTQSIQKLKSKYDTATHSFKTPSIASLLTDDTTEQEVEREKEKENEKVYKCNDCHKSFQRAAWLRRHVLTHTNYRQFRCIWCSSKHKRRDNLFKHIKIKHMEQLMDSIQNFYPLANFETRDLNKLVQSGQLHREDIKKVILSIIEKGQVRNVEVSHVNDG